MSGDSDPKHNPVPRRSAALERLLGKADADAGETAAPVASEGAAAAASAPARSEDPVLPGDELPGERRASQDENVSLAWELETLRGRFLEAQEELSRLRVANSSHERLLNLLAANAEFLVSADPAKLPQRILEISLELVGAERAGFFRISKEGALRKGLVLPEGATFNAISHSVVRDALLERRSILHLGSSAQEGQERRSILELDLETVVATPLLVGERLLGVLYLDGTRAGKFSSADVPALEIFTGLAAAAMLRLEELQTVRVEKRELERENQELKSVLNDKTSYGNILAASPAMKKVIEQIQRMARYRSTVRIFGETGTGKELIARALHNESPWAKQPFVTINCGAIPETLLEAELFGHEKGAFTGADSAKAGLFEQADGGSLFLDEIGDMPPSLQIKLLRVLENGEVRRVGGSKVSNVDVRVIAASHRNLEQRVEDGDFREDLFYRLNVLSISLPPLRERPEDVELLAKHFLLLYAERMDLDCRGLSAGALRLLQAQPWPGNVRQLEKCIERSLALWDGRRVMEEEHLMLDSVTGAASRVDQRAASNEGETLKTFLRRMERSKIAQALEQGGGKITRAAAILGISRQYLHRKVKELELR